MKTIFTKFILAISLTAGLQLLAQSPSWQWGRGAGMGGSELATGSALDASGNLYVVGWYTSPNITFGAFTLVNPGNFSSDIFLVKYDPSGTALWAKTFGGTDGEAGNGVAVDASGNVYITGLFTSTMMVMGTQTLTNPTAGSDIFIAKIDPSGTTIWAKSAGGNGADRGNGITIDQNGNVYTCGSFLSSSINFGTGALTNAGTTTSDFFIAKHDANGNALWARSVGGANTEAGNSIATDSLGNVYTTGYFSSTSVNFGTGALNNASSGTQDLFLVKYNGAGTAVWSRQSGGSMDEFGNGIAVRKNSVYITGGFMSATIGFGSTTLTNSSAGTSDILLAMYDLNGTAVWARRSGGADFEAGQSVATDVTGNAYVTGYFISNSITFGTITLNNSAPTFRDLFIITYDAMGNAMWGVANGGSFDEIGYGISVSGTGIDIHIAGMFNSASVTFGPSTITKGCGDDVMVAKLLGPLVGIKEEKGPSKYKLYPNPSHGKITVEADGQIFFYNTLGENVRSEKLYGETQIDLTSLHEGVYFFKILTDKKEAQAGRVVIQ